MKKRAFTMIEIIMVLVLFGIIAGIGAEIISKMYKNYIQSRTINYLQSQSNIAVEQIAKRLQYRIKDTTIARISGAGGDIKTLNDPAVNTNYNVIEWIGYSNEAMLGNTPGWSGFIDLESATTSKTPGTLDTPGSNLNDVTTITTALNNDTAVGTFALIFKQRPAGFYDPNAQNGYGWRNAGATDIDYLVPVKIGGATQFNIAITGRPADVYEQYYLAHTAYAIHRVANTDDGSNANDNFALALSYNYRPWIADETYDAASTAIIAEHVNLFRIKQVGSTIRIKLCLHDNGKSGAAQNLVACKEEVIF